MTARRSLGAIALLGVITTGDAAAADPVGSVSGVVTLAPGARERPERNRGFVARAANPLKPPRPMNPLPYVVVVLEDGPISPADRQPPREPVRYSIIGESFASPVFPIVTGASVELKNEGKGAHRLQAPAQPELLSGDPINPKGVRVAKKLDLRYQSLELRDPDSPHLSGWLVGIPHPYFARLDDGGRFTIKNVPPGSWRVRVWYRDGWLTSAGDQVSVAANREAAVNLTLPVKLVTEAGGT